MEAAGLDALLLFSGPNLTYLAGSSVTELTSGRAWYLLLPREGEPALVVQRWRERQARQETWIDDVRAYQKLSEAPLEELERAWADRGLGAARVGVELGAEMRLGITVEEFERIKAHFAGATFVDASSLLWDLRLVKDEGEVRNVRRACAITGAAFARLFSEVRAGMTAAEVVRRMKIYSIELGGSSPWVLASIGRGHYEWGTEVVDETPLEPGDLVWMDAGCAVGGYWSDYSRAAVIGAPSAAQRELWQAVHDATAAGVERIRPGVPVADIAGPCDEAMRALDGDGVIPLSTLAGRIGHGLGLDVTELPHIAPYDSTVLRPGMIVTVEPAIATADGTFHVEENVLVTETGCEVLSTAPWELVEAPDRPA